MAIRLFSALNAWFHTFCVRSLKRTNSANVDAVEARQNLTAPSPFLLITMAALSKGNADTLQWLLRGRGLSPATSVELLNLVDQQSMFEGIADGRCGYVGNPHEATVSSLEKLYVALDEYFGHPPETHRARCLAAVTSGLRK